MPNRIRIGLARTLVCLVLPLLAFALRTLDAAVPAGDRSASSPRHAGILPPRIRPYLIDQERRARRTALRLALDGIDVGPRIIHGHHVGTPVTVAAPVSTGVAA